jgi:hypothetical protein
VESSPSAFSALTSPADCRLCLLQFLFVSHRLMIEVESLWNRSEEAPSSVNAVVGRVLAPYICHMFMVPFTRSQSRLSLMAPVVGNETNKLSHERLQADT